MSANVRRLARSIAVDVSSDGGTTWLRLPSRVDNNPAITPNKVDSTDTDTSGFTSSEITLQSGVLTVKYNSLINGGVPNPAHELVEACVAQFADAARLNVRYYDLEPGGTRGYQALAIVEVAYANTGVADLRTVQVTFTFDGTITKMTTGQITTAQNNSALPVITSASQSGTGVGSAVKLVGSNFTGATAAKFGATSGTALTVVSDSVIVVNVPTGGTGAQTLTVVTPAGTSAGFAFTVA